MADKQGAYSRGMSVLVADDDQSLLRLVTKVLDREGFKVDSAASGREVLARVHEGRPSLLLLDYTLPDMSGRQVVEELTARGTRVPFIVMTGHGDERLAVDMMKLGARDYVMKDVAFVELLPSVVRQAVEQIEVERRLKATEEGLKQSEEKFAKAFRLSPNWVFILTLEDGTIVEANDTFIGSTGFRRGEVVGTSCRDLGLCANPSHWRGMFETLLAGDEFRNKELTVRVKSGDERVLLISAEAIEFGDQKCALCMAHDITERKHDHERIMAALKEKDHLLKEIHHRVKNNLQVITSLLNLQCRNMDDKTVRMIFEELGNRIKSMALVHEMLYGADDFSGVDFGAYVNTLLDNLYRSLGVSRRRVVPALDLDGVRMGIDFAVPCGLIINELASNTLKYAFPDDREGRLFISMETEGSSFTLKVEDDGKGFPESVDFGSADSLGLKLVRLLAERQLAGSAECSTGPEGTRIRIGFSMEENREQR